MKNKKSEAEPSWFLISAIPIGLCWGSFFRERKQRERKGCIKASG